MDEANQDILGTMTDPGPGDRVEDVFSKARAAREERSAKKGKRGPYKPRKAPAAPAVEKGEKAPAVEKPKPFVMRDFGEVSETLAKSGIFVGLSVGELASRQLRGKPFLVPEDFSEKAVPAHKLMVDYLLSRHLAEAGNEELAQVQAFGGVAAMWAAVILFNFTGAGAGVENGTDRTDRAASVNSADRPTWDR